MTLLRVLLIERVFACIELISGSGAKIGKVRFGFGERSLMQCWQV